MLIQTDFGQKNPPQTDIDGLQEGQRDKTTDDAHKTSPSHVTKYY